MNLEAKEEVTSKIFPRHCFNTTPTIASGRGVYLYDNEGKQYFDGSGGAAVSCLGHGDPAVSQAIKDQLDHVSFAHTGFFTSDPAERLAEKLTDHAPGNLDRVYIVSGGSEAMEAALKLARQYCIEIGQPERHHIIARRQSYHGNTLGALATGGNHWRREPFAPLLLNVSHVAPCYAYRDQADEENSASYVSRLLSELEAEIQKLGPENVMAFVAEPVVGATMGAVPAVDGYFIAVRELCDRHGILLVLDEVMCGMGRTGTLFACEQDGIAPDICAIAKGLGAGYQPIGAMMCTAEIYNAVRDGSGFFQHGHTYLAHPTACAAAGAVLTRIIDDDLLQRVEPLGKSLDAHLKARLFRNPHVGDIRGRGLFRGIELVADRESKLPFAPELKVHARIKKEAFDRGLICYPMGGTIDGRSGDHVLLAPPFIMNETEVEELAMKTAESIESVLANV